jgi:hypothetical protein
MQINAESFIDAIVNGREQRSGADNGKQKGRIDEAQMTSTYPHAS